MKKLFALALLLSAAFALYAGGKADNPDPFTADTAENRGYYTGNGGKGTSLAILTPEGKNLTPAEAYLTTLVQSVFVGDISKFTAISVLDRQSLEKVLRENESGIYAEGQDFAELGEIAGQDYYLSGMLTKTASGFALQIQVTDTRTGMIKASYSGSCTAGELDNFTGIKKASLDLLDQMGVQLTAKGRAELTGTGTQQSIDAETALARGIAAQRSGSGARTTIETMYYLYEAQSYDPALLEASQRLSAIQAGFQVIEKPAILQSATVSTGNIGADARNEIQRYQAQTAYEAAVREQNIQYQNELKAQRQELIALLLACEDFYTEHPPFEIWYDPNIESGNLNYTASTIDLNFYIATVPAASGMDMLKTIEENLRNLEKTMDKVGAEKQQWTLDKWQDQRLGRTFSIDVALSDDQGKVISRSSIYLKNNLRDGDILRPVAAVGNVVFNNVGVNDITDKLVLTITNVNGIAIESERGGAYIKITQAQFSDRMYNIGGFNRQGWDISGYDTTGYDKEGYNRKKLDRFGSRWIDSTNTMYAWLAGYNYTPTLPIGFRVGAIYKRGGGYFGFDIGIETSDFPELTRSGYGFDEILETKQTPPYLDVIFGGYFRPLNNNLLVSFGIGWWECYTEYLLQEQGSKSSWYFNPSDPGRESGFVMEAGLLYYFKLHFYVAAGYKQLFTDDSKPTFYLGAGGAFFKKQ
ncbi:hypothetical protein FACS189444_4570 [Spirochaetia bacterium]|nr:hypothetical protein FACS189444_4570 [Spirochaetia bacterium]